MDGPEHMMLRERSRHRRMHVCDSIDRKRPEQASDTETGSGFVVPEGLGEGVGGVTVRECSVSLGG